MDGWQIDVSLNRRGGEAGHPRLLQLLSAGVLFIAVFSGFYLRTVQSNTSQPAPYDMLMVVTMALFFALGLRLPKGLGAPAMFWGVVLLGYGFSGISAIYIERVTDFILVMAYLICTLLFFAAVIVSEPRRYLPVIWWSYTWSAFLVSLAGCLAYFRLLPNSDFFLVASRVSGTFNDPNVFGPFLVPPILFLIYTLSTSSRARDLVLLPVVGVIILGVFLSFSRGAWGVLVASGLMFLVLTWLTATSARQIARLTTGVILMGVMATCIIAWALSTDIVADLFKERFALTQSYDVAETGRFGTQRRAIQTILETPMGLGPSQWTAIHKVDPHNVYLNIFLAGGWLSGFAFLGFCALTVYAGLKSCFVAGFSQNYQIVAMSALCAHLAEAFIIDIDNWRHVYLLMGLVWGGILLSRQGRAARGRQTAPIGQAYRGTRDGFAC